MDWRCLSINMYHTKCNPLQYWLEAKLIVALQCWHDICSLFEPLQVSRCLFELVCRTVSSISRSTFACDTVTERKPGCLGARACWCGKSQWADLYAFLGISSALWLGWYKPFVWQQKGADDGETLLQRAVELNTVLFGTFTTWRQKATRLACIRGHQISQRLSNLNRSLMINIHIN